jgi:hypothetical protein
MLLFFQRLLAHVIDQASREKFNVNVCGVVIKMLEVTAAIVHQAAGSIEMS